MQEVDVTVDLRCGDCLDILPTLESNSIDAVVTDPPAGISFMGKEWDRDKGGRNAWVTWMTQVAAECLRVLKPGGYALVWALPRTSHWTSTAWEDGGFEVRDRIAYCFGSGFPKGSTADKMIDKKFCRESLIEKLGRKPTKAEFKAAWKEWREVVGRKNGDRYKYKFDSDFNPEQPKSRLGSGDAGALTAPATDAAREWAGWGTALKPAVEDWWVFRKPLSEATVAANVLRWGCGAMNIDACRISVDDSEKPAIIAKNDSFKGRKGDNIGVRKIAAEDVMHSIAVKDEIIERTVTLGRWPAHLILDGSPEVVAMFPANASPGNGQRTITRRTDYDGLRGGKAFAQKSGKTYLDHGDTGSAARFFKSCPPDDDDLPDYPPLFYCAKASKRDRDEGCEELKKEAKEDHNLLASTFRTDPRSPNGGYENKPAPPGANHHPTVKPTSLMRYLCRLVTPPGGIVLDPFMGSGSTGKGAVLEGFGFIGCELDAEYFEIAQKRIAEAQAQERLMAKVRK